MAEMAGEDKAGRGSGRLVHHNEHDESTGNTTGPAICRSAQRLPIRGDLARSRRTRAADARHSAVMQAHRTLFTGWKSIRSRVQS
jgi:hypothetical protein